MMTISGRFIGGEPSLTRITRVARIPEQEPLFPWLASVRKNSVPARARFSQKATKITKKHASEGSVPSIDCAPKLISPLSRSAPAQLRTNSHGTRARANGMASRRSNRPWAILFTRPAEALWRRTQIGSPRRAKEKRQRGRPLGRGQ